MTLSVAINLGGAVLNLILFKLSKNPVNLGCAVIGLIFAAYFYMVVSPTILN